MIADDSFANKFFPDEISEHKIFAGNIIFNVNRESVAHGTIDSWERQPYINDMGMLREPVGFLEANGIVPESVRRSVPTLENLYISLLSREESA